MIPPGRERVALVAAQRHDPVRLKLSLSRSRGGAGDSFPIKNTAGCYPSDADGRIATPIAEQQVPVADSSLMATLNFPEKIGVGAKPHEKARYFTDTVSAKGLGEARNVWNTMNL